MKIIEKQKRLFVQINTAYLKIINVIDKSGSGNTANIGSIKNIYDIVSENGIFSKLGESWFDDYWMNYNKITIKDGRGSTKKITNIKEFVEYRKGNVSLICRGNSSKLKDKK